MNKMKILHIMTRLAGGGGEKNIVETVNGLNELGYEVHLMVGRDSNESALKKTRLANSVKLVFAPALVHRISPMLDFIACREIYRIVKSERYNVVHTHFSKAGVLGRVAAKIAHVPCIIHGVHGAVFPKTISPVKRCVYCIIERYCGGFTNGFVAVGEDIKKKFVSAGVGMEKKYSVIHSGIDYEEFDKAARNSPEKLSELRKDIGINVSDIIIGMVSRLEKSKGYDYLLEAASNIVKRWNNVKFVIVGDGDQTDDLKNVVKKMGISRNVMFTGYRSDVADIISIFDIAVFTSIREGLPQFLIQASLLSKPIVTFDVDGAREIVKEGQNGFIVPMRDTRCLANKLYNLICDGEFRLRMGSISHQMVNRNWTVENMVKETDELYQKLLCKSAPISKTSTLM